MEYPHAICLTRDRRFVLHVRQAIGLTCARITMVADITELSAAWSAAADLLLLDAQCLEQGAGLPRMESRVFLESIGHGEVVLVAPAQLQTCVDMLSIPSCNNVVAGDPMSSGTELLTVVRKSRNRDLFGLKKYVPWGGHCFESRVHSLLDKRNVVRWLAATARRVGCTRWLALELEMAADEMLSNAIYPQSTQPTERHDAPLSPALLRWTCSEGCIHVSVTDQRGAFEKQTLIDALQRLTTDSSDELSILGLPRQIALAQRLVVNVVPGVQAELILSVPLRGRKTPVPSVSFFTATDVVDEAAVATREPVTISLNGRLRLDVLGIDCQVSIHEINALHAEVTLQESITTSIYPGLHFTLGVNVPFHGELTASGLIFRVVESEPTVLSLSFATGHQQWERVLRTVLGAQ